MQDQTPPNDPGASHDLGQEDLLIPRTDLASILLETRNIDVPPADPHETVQVRITPKYGGPNLTEAVYESGTRALALWSVDLAIPSGFMTLQARAFNPAYEP